MYKHNSSIDSHFIKEMNLIYNVLAEFNVV